MKTEMRNGRKYFVYDSAQKETVDMTALKMMECNDMETLLPFQYVRQEEESSFRYEAGSAETLAQWLVKPQYRTNVIRLLESLIHMEEEREAYLLEPDHIYIDASFVIVSNDICKAAYIPTVESTQGSLLDLTLNIISSVRYALDEDFGYLFDLQNAFGRKDIQTTDDLKKWLRIVSGEEKADSGDAAIETGADAAMGAEVVQTPIERPIDSLEGVFGDLGLGSGSKNKKDKHFAFLAKGRKKEKQEKDMVLNIMQEHADSVKSPVQSSEIINNLERGDVTVMMDEGQMPKLIHIESNMEYSLVNGSYTIGSGAQADIVIQNNKTVSRNHARIFKDSDYWYIEDAGSTNGTCANGEMLRKKEPYKLVDGVRIQFSNEKYIFKMD